MKFEDFKLITEKLIEHEKIKNETCKYLNHEEVFDSIEIICNRLLEQIYNNSAINVYYDQIFSGHIEDMDRLHRYMEGEN